MFDAKDSGENGNHLRPLVAKKMFDKLRHAIRFWHNGFQRHHFCHTLKAHKDNKL